MDLSCNWERITLAIMPSLVSCYPAWRPVEGSSRLPARRIGSESLVPLMIGITCRSARTSPWRAYGQSKLANVLFAKALDDRLKGEDTEIMSVSLHPGVVATNLWRSTGPRLLQDVIKGVIGDRNIEQGAATSVYASLIDSSAFVGGEYLSDCAIAETSEKGADADGKLRQKLWEETEQMIADAGCDLPEGLLR